MFIPIPRNSLVSQLHCAVIAAGVLVGVPSNAQHPADSDIFQKVNASVAARDQNVLGYTVTEHYSVFRNQEKVHPAAEMTVKTTYRKDAGKSYEVITESGSEFLLKEVLARVLDSEKTMSQPANRAGELITTQNYNMTVQSAEVVDGRQCIRVAIAPRRTAPNLFKGTIWVDAQDGSIVALEGIASKSPTMLAGAAEVARHYAQIDGFPMATHATATTGSWLLGQTTIEIEYTGYQIMLQTTH